MYTAFERLVTMGKVVPMPLTGKISGYVWYEAAAEIMKNEKGKPHGTEPTTSKSAGFHLA
jgi:hypothetical protein